MTELPLGVADVDLDRDLSLAPFPQTPDRQPAAWSTLVRLHSRPLAILTVAASETDADTLASVIWTELGPVIEAHLRADGLPAAGGLARIGLGRPERAACLAARRAFLEGAPSVSVVVATRDRPAEAVRCVESLLALEYPDFEVIVVDNSTVRGTTPAALEERFAGHPLLRCVTEDQAGTSRARNRGTELARGDVVAFVDDDVWVDPQWLAQLTIQFAADPRVGCVTGLILPAELETAAQRWFEEFGGFGRGLRGRTFSLDDPETLGPLFPFSAGQFGSGANMAFRRPALVAAGGFDPHLGGGARVPSGEDLDVFIDMLVAGHRLAYEPAALIRHWHRRSLTGLRRQQRAYGRGLGAHFVAMVLDRPELAAHLRGNAGRAIAHLARWRVLPGGGPNGKPTYPRAVDVEWFVGLAEGAGLSLIGRVATRGEQA